MIPSRGWHFSEASWSRRRWWSWRYIHRQRSSVIDEQEWIGRRTIWVIVAIEGTILNRENQSDTFPSTPAEHPWSNLFFLAVWSFRWALTSTGLACPWRSSDWRNPVREFHFRKAEQGRQLRQRELGQGQTKDPLSFIDKLRLSEDVHNEWSMLITSPWVEARSVNGPVLTTWRVTRWKRNGRCEATSWELVNKNNSRERALRSARIER